MCQPIVMTYLQRYHLPLMILIGVIFGASFPYPGMALNDLNMHGICLANDDICVFNQLSHVCVFLIFIISGISLDTKQLNEALHARLAFFVGMLCILVLTPPIAFLTISSPLLQDPPEMAFGLSIFLIVPTTLATGVAVTKMAEGNIPVSVILTVCSNLVGVITVPILVSWLIPLYPGAASNNGSENIDVHIRPAPMIVQLVFTIVIPMAIGQLLQYSSSLVRDIAKAHKFKLTLLSSFFLAMIAFLQASDGSSSFALISAGSILLCLFVFGAIHLTFIVMIYCVSTYIAKLPLEEVKSVVIMGCQKSLPISMSILTFIPEEIVPDIAVASIPIIMCQLLQTLVDSFAAAEWASRTPAITRSATLTNNNNDNHEQMNNSRNNNHHDIRELELQQT